LVKFNNRALKYIRKSRNKEQISIGDTHYSEKPSKQNNLQQRTQAKFMFKVASNVYSNHL